MCTSSGSIRVSPKFQILVVAWSWVRHVKLSFKTYIFFQSIAEKLCAEQTCVLLKMFSKTSTKLLTQTYCSEFNFEYTLYKICQKFFFSFLNMTLNRKILLNFEEKITFFF